MLSNFAELKAQGRFDAVNAAIPYSKFIGLECEVTATGLVTVMRHRESNIGNPLLPAIHGGVIGGALEHAATLALLFDLDLEHVPRIINISIDYLRPARDRDTFLRASFIRQGRRVANVRVEAWQDDPTRAVAAAHAHFLLA